MWMCFYDAYFPGWYFQGIEQMKWITILSVLTRSIFTLGIFLIINSPEDYLLYPIAHGIGAMATIIISFYIIHVRHKIPLKYVSKSQIVNTLKESSPVFISNLAINSSSSLSKIFVGNSLSFADVAVYDLGEKILTILRTPLSILSQVLLPKTSRIKAPVNSLAIRNMMLIIGMVLTLIGLASSKWLVSFLGSGEMNGAWKYVMVFICYIPFHALHSFYSVLFLIPYGRQNVFMRITLFIGIFTGTVFYTMHIFHCPLLYYVIGGLMIEMFSVLLLHYQAHKLIKVKYEL
jgi:PST family polysaccharide transporter